MKKASLSVPTESAAKQKEAELRDAFNRPLTTVAPSHLLCVPSFHLTRTSKHIYIRVQDEVDEMVARRKKLSGDGDDLIEKKSRLQRQLLEAQSRQDPKRYPLSLSLFMCSHLIPISFICVCVCVFAIHYYC